MMRCVHLESREIEAKGIGCSTAGRRTVDQPPLRGGSIPSLPSVAEPESAKKHQWNLAAGLAVT